MNIENKKDIWEKIKTKLKCDKEISPDIYNNYISNSFLFKQMDQNLIVSVKSKLGKKIINGVHDHILKILEKEFKLVFNIKYETNEELKKASQPQINIFSNNINNSNKDKYFDNFISGECNESAYNSAKLVADEPGVWNPLFLYGDSGLGKTHLLLSIKNRVKNNFKDFNVSYISSEEFGSLTIENMQKGYSETEEFKNYFKNLDVLLIDDIQLLARRPKTNELFFYILNHFIEHRKQIVISSDKMPDELKNGFEKRLISRFNSGLNIHISNPDYNTALGIVKLKLKNSKNYRSFSKEAVEYIAKNFSLDVRKLEGTINRMLFYSILQKKEKNELINVDDIKKAFEVDDFIDVNKKISIKYIQNIICSEYNITNKILLGKSRISNIAKARQVAMYFSRKLTDLRLIDISQKFKRKDHTTVINAIKKVEKEMNSNKDYKKFITLLEEKIKK